MTTYYVSKSGNDNNSGTATLPWLTIQKAANSMMAGDTVLIQRGTYNEFLKINISGLSNNARCVFSSYPGDEKLVIIDGTSKNPSNGLVDIEANYIIFQNIKVQNTAAGTSGTGIYAGAHHDITIFNCFTYNTAGLGIGAVGSSSVLIDSNEVELAANGNFTECLDTINCNGFEVRDNYVHDGGYGAGSPTNPTKGGNGIDIFQSQNGSVHHNTVVNTKRSGLYLDGSKALNQNIDVYSNIVHDCINGAQMSISTEFTTGNTNNIRFYNNILYHGVDGTLFLMDGSYGNISNILIINNTLGDGSIVLFGPNLSGNITISNNVYMTANVRNYSGTVTKSNNWEMYMQGSSGLFVNSTGNDYHLIAGSRLIDIGTPNGAPSFDFDGNPRPQGTGFDIGAYEYVPTTPTLSVKLSISPNMITLEQSSTFTATASGGITPYTYSWTGLPTGCVASNSNVITCVPNTVGTYPVTVTVKDSAIPNQNTVSTQGTLVVNPKPTNPIFIQEAETPWNSNTSPKTTPSFNVKKGDILVAYCMMENYGSLTISGGSLTWILRQSVVVTNYAPVYIWTATVDIDKTMAVKFSTSSALFFGGNVITFRNSSGIGNSSKTYVLSGAPELNLTTSKANSAIVVANCDWLALDGISRSWRTNAGIFNEKTYFRDSARYTVYGGYHPNSGSIGIYAVGLAAPINQKYSIVAVEIKC